MDQIANYALSLHYTPAAVTTVTALVVLACGVSWKWALLIFLLGVAFCAAVFYVMPMQFFAPLGGKFNVGLHELRGERGAMKPPLSVFYPTISGAPRGGIGYLPFGDLGYVEGMARYSGFPSFVLKDLSLMRKKIRPDAVPVPLFQRDGAPRPIIIFSHGLSGYPHLYTALIMDMVARGAIVFAMSHMDGSAALCRDAGREIRIRLNTNVQWTTEDRAPQLEIRIRETLNTIKRVRSGEALLGIGYDKATVDRYISLDPRVHLVGHSFGGATCLAACLEETHDAKDRHRESCIASAVVYDPWTVPMRKTMFYDKLVHKKTPYHFTTPTLQIFTEGWKKEKERHHEFFTDVYNVVLAQNRTPEEEAVVAAADAKLKSINATWYTMKDYPATGHLTCTDVSLFSPIVWRAEFMKAKPRGVIVEYAFETLRFIEKLSGSLPLDVNLLDDPILAAALRA